MNQHEPHLLGHGGEGVPHHLEAHRIEAHVRTSSTAPEGCTVPHQPDSTSAVASRPARIDRKSTRLNSSHSQISYAVFCLKKKKTAHRVTPGPTREPHVHLGPPPAALIARP